ncbi:TonB-dependent siderophore receptor [Rodentibacter haemolyticus]|uniref:TonB-dependent siderophore receptor n=1 Tax=Rodentibacter haemolyticus TaxID=2778911 RepID=A0ABX6UWD0_9PAST|nr:TonB-dependent siderophore receptor [Rodentibacter haemolyticus]QPB42398.1 TonB-dependent siderophore receptor [Rodentibacter haemolyticus]
MKKNFVYSALASAVIFAVNSAQAETKNVEELDEINVVGSVAKAGKVDYMAPRSIAVINDETLKNWELNQLDASLRYETGTLAQVYGADLDTNDWVKVRGMDSRLTIDGSAVYNTGYSHWSPNMYGVEAVEVVKGADSLTYGSAQSGGLINLITKRPTAEPKGEVNLKLGNRHERGISADISDKAAESVRYRLVADYHKKQGELRGTWLESYYFAPSLTWDISNRTSLTLLASLQKDVGVPTTGFFPMQGTLYTNLGKIDRRTNLGDPTTDTLNRKQYSLGYEFTHKFDDSLTFSQNYKFNMQDVKQQSAFSNGVTVFPIIGQGAVFNDVITRSHSLDNRLTKNWKGDNYENSLTLGVDYQYLTAKGAYNSYYMPYSVPATYTPLYTLNSVSPVYNGIQVPNNARPNYDVTQRQLGFYLQDQVKIGNWHLSAGVRNDRAKGEEGEKSYKINHTSYSGGVMYVAENGLAPYFSYSESFVPETAQYKPTEGRQYEAGIKYLPSFIDGTFSIAYFDLKQDNAFTPSATGNAFQTKELRSKGVEVAANFNVAEKTAIVLGYTFNRVKDIRETGNVIRPALIPRHTASAQVTYQFLDNLIAGAAIRYIGTSSNGTADNIKAPAKTLADIMLKYRLNTNWELQANVSNLTDKKYVASCFYSTCYYGEGRRFSANLSYKW